MDPYFRKPLLMKKILEYTEKNNIDFIVMGTYSLAGVKNFLTGNVVEKVVRHSRVPVMVIRGMQALKAC
jgi:nucleotide-binding universal stress UspA family protein